MIIVLKPEAGENAARGILEVIRKAGLKPLYMPGVERTVIGAIGDERVLGRLHLENYPEVEKLTPILTPYKLVSREARPEGSRIAIGSAEIGGPRLMVIAGPCAVESPEQIRAAAEAVRDAGGHVLRGGAFKPRTSPYSFQGLGVEGLALLQAAARDADLPCITEVVEVADVAAVRDLTDGFQVGARNMQNYRLLQRLGEESLPVILKRGMAASCEDLLLAAEYIVAAGNPNVILCERGIRTFETCTRNTLDLSAVPHLKRHTHLPVLVDPSHGTGIREYVAPMARAAVACGADGLLIEVHPDPAHALSDGAQSLYPEAFRELMKSLAAVAWAVGRTL